MNNTNETQSLSEDRAQQESLSARLWCRYWNLLCDDKASKEETRAAHRAWQMSLIRREKVTKI